MPVPSDFTPEDLAVLLPFFRASGAERIAGMRHTLGRLEQVPDDTEALTTLHRAAHSLKGAALQLGFARIGMLARAMETAAAASRTQSNGMPADALPLFARCADRLEIYLQDLDADDDASDTGEDLLGELEAMTARLAA
jgi:two-component system chemotaxis sensor kinase CheA